jgi:hypothetical protein
MSINQTQLLIPRDEAFLLNLVLQRTQYLIETGNSQAISNWTQTGDTQLILGLIQDDTWRIGFLNNTIKSANDDAQSIISSLPNSPHGGVITSIGPGNGIVELILSYHLKPSALVLIDIEETPGRHHHGFSEKGAGYASLQSTSSFITSNLLQMNPGEKLIPTIVQVNPKKQILPKIESDLCISLLSAGFHYPISEYARYLSQTMSTGSCLIFDARDPVQSLSELSTSGIEYSMQKPLCISSKFTRLNLKKGNSKTQSKD